MEHYRRAWSWGVGGLLVGFAAFAFVAFRFGPGGRPGWVRYLLWLTGAGLPAWLAYVALHATWVAFLLFCAELPRRVFRRLVPAVCPRCRGDAYWEGGEPVTYACRACGYRHDTGIRESETD